MGGSDWTWVPATYYQDAGPSNHNDEYVADIGAYLPTTEIYYYASRFRLNGSDFSYGGIASDNVGNFWDDTALPDPINNGIVTITD